MQNITQEKLRTLLEYDPDNGWFIWRVSRAGNRVKVGNRAGYVHPTGYRYVRVDGHIVTEHRLAWFFVYGQWPTKDLDHINRVRHDNRISNLRELSRAENCQNQPIRRSNKSGATGVYYHKASKKWAASINIGCKQIHLGVYATQEEAVKIRRNAELEHYPYANPCI